MTRRILDGFQRAAIVFVSNELIGAEVRGSGLVSPERVVVAPLGFAEEFRPDSPVDAGFRTIVDKLGGAPFVLHVGSCIPRKRIDVLLAMFAKLREKRPDLWLVKAGGEWTAEQRDQIRRLGIGDWLVHVPVVPRETLANLYRETATVLLPSDAEGFGLPALEALACGGSVLASDLPVFRSFAGDAIAYARAGDVEDFAQHAATLLAGARSTDTVARRVAVAARFSWKRHAEIIVDAYDRLLNGNSRNA
jgi:glycosyltransferase involved in cell wall biosynthesis